MGQLGIDGLVSGLDTTSLIKQLMQVESMPQALLVRKQSTAQNFVSALQALNAKMSSLGDAAKTASTAKSWAAHAATSSSESVTASTKGAAQNASLTFKVDAVAASQISIVDVPTTFEGDPPSFTVVRNGVETVITAASGNVNDVVAAFNDSDSGVRAVAVRVSGGDTPTYKLQFTGTETGAENSFEIFQGEQAGGTQFVTSANASRAAQDARITLFPDTADATELTSAKNTFTDLTPGVDVTVSRVEADPVTVTISKDTEALTKLASNMVSQLGIVLSEISSRSATTTTTGDDGRTIVTGGIFTGDSSVRGMQQQILSAASTPVDGFSPSEVGIEIGRDGTFTFNEEKFAQALAADPAKVQRIVSGVGANIEKLATSTSDKYDGALTNKIKSQETAIKDMGEQISAWDRRLELRKAGLERTYSALEVTLSKLQSQSSWLAGQLGSLQGNN